MIILFFKILITLRKNEQLEFGQEISTCCFWVIWNPRVYFLKTENLMPADEIFLIKHK